MLRVGRMTGDQMHSTPATAQTDPAAAAECSAMNKGIGFKRKSFGDKKDKTTNVDLGVGAKVYRDRLKGLYVVARSLFLLYLTCSAWPCLGPA